MLTLLHHGLIVTLRMAATCLIVLIALCLWIGVTFLLAALASELLRRVWGWF